VEYRLEICNPIRHWNASLCLRAECTRMCAHNGRQHGALRGMVAGLCDVRMSHSVVVNQ